VTTGEARPGAGFYRVIPHGAMVAIFAPVFLLALIAMALSVRNFWRATASPAVDGQSIRQAIIDVVTMKNLTGGHGDGCNYEAEDAFSLKRRSFHQMTFWGFLLCFASTSVATLQHYLFASPAPYGFWSLPKLLGIPGGLLLCAGTAGLLALKSRSDTNLDARAQNGLDTGFTVLLFLVGLSGLLLYLLRGSALMTPMLALHLGAVLAFFVTLPYSKMVHGFYRFATLLRAAQEARTIKPAGGGSSG
jgi:citrate/tricarballylate utilization protein